MPVISLKSGGDGIGYRRKYVLLVEGLKNRLLSLGSATNLWVAGYSVLLDY